MRILLSLYNDRKMFLLISDAILIVSSIFIASCIYSFITWHWFEPTILIGQILLATVVSQLSLYLRDFYELKTFGNRVDLARCLGSALMIASVFMAIAYWFIPTIVLLPSIWIISIPIAFIALFIEHIWLEKRNSSVLIIGTGDMAKAIAKEICNNPALGINVCGFLAEDESQMSKPLINPSILGTFEDLESLVSHYHVDHVLVASQDRRGHLPMESLLNLKLSGVTVEEGATFFEKTSGKLPVEELNPSYLIFSTGFQISRMVLFNKRLFSIIFSLLGLIIASPFMLLIAIAIKLDSKGPVFFYQDRIGKDGRVFKLIKFRSMRVDAEAKSGPMWAKDHDARVTRVGRFIRATRIDELPQFINVLKGDMQLVGPRPERPYFVEQLQKIIPYYKQRHTVQPGLTGWAQVKYPYGATIEEAREKLKYDLYYIKNMSLFLDIWTILQTVKIMLLRRGAR